MSIFGDAHHHHHPEDLAELALLREQIRLQKLELAELHAIRKELGPKQLSSIKVQFIPGGTTMPVGPLSVTVGTPVTASVVGFDQFGAPFTGALPAATFTDDNAAVATIDPASGAIATLSAGVTNVSASLTSAEGLALTDAEVLTVTAVAPVLTSIKVSLDAAPVAAASVRK